MAEEDLTPGSWEAAPEPYREEWWNPNGWYDVFAPPEHVNQWGDVERNRVALTWNYANARFIAAAPDMLEALYMMRHEFEQLVAVPRAFQAFTKLEAAIAKATGT